MNDCEKHPAKGTECDYGAILGLAKKLKEKNLLQGFDDAIATLGNHILPINKTDGKECNSCIERTILLNPRVKEMIIKISKIVIQSNNMKILTHPGASAIATLEKRITPQGGRRKLRKTSKKTSKKKTSKKRKTSRRKGRK